MILTVNYLYSATRQFKEEQISGVEILVQNPKTNLMTADAVILDALMIDLT